MRHYSILVPRKKWRVCMLGLSVYHFWLGPFTTSTAHSSKNTKKHLPNRLRFLLPLCQELLLHVSQGIWTGHMVCIGRLKANIIYNWSDEKTPFIHTFLHFHWSFTNVFDTKSRLFLPPQPGLPGRSCFLQLFGPGYAPNLASKPLKSL